MKKFLTIWLFLSALVCTGQNNLSFDSLHKLYSGEMRIVSNSFSEGYYPNGPTIYSLDEKIFLKEIDTFKLAFIKVSNIWFDRRFTGKVASLRNDFLKKHGYN